MNMSIDFSFTSEFKFMLLNNCEWSNFRIKFYVNSVLTQLFFLFIVFSYNISESSLQLDTN